MSSGNNTRIEPNPRHPLGGHALIILEAVSAGQDSEVTILREADGHYLGQHGWQAGATSLRPDAVRVDGGNTILEVGPNFVDQIETYTRIRIELPSSGTRASATWPDDIVPSPGQAKAGAIHSLRREEASPAAPKPRPEPPSEPEEEPADQDADLPVEPPVERDERDDGTDNKGGRTWLWVAIAAIALAAALGFFLWPKGLDEEADEPTVAETDEMPAPAPAPSEQPAPEPAPAPTPVPAPIPEPPLETTAACSQERLRDAIKLEDAEAIAALTKLFESCGPEDSPDVRFAAVEQAASRGHGPSLFQLGRWYDPAFSELEDSPLPPLPASAVRYYKQAADLGADGAAEALQQICALLTSSADGTEKSAGEVYCPE